jgi:hypothetical protein
MKEARPVQDPNHNNVHAVPDHPAWCTDHFHPTDLDASSVHRSALVAWGAGHLRLEDYGDGPRVYLDFDEPIWLRPDSARLLASALLDADRPRAGHRPMSDTTDRMYELLVEANALLASPPVDDDRREAYMAAKRSLLDELDDEDVTR